MNENPVSISLHEVADGKIYPDEQGNMSLVSTWLLKICFCKADMICFGYDVGKHPA